jgi:hypothetical protein
VENMVETDMYNMVVVYDNSLPLDRYCNQNCNADNIAPQEFRGMETEEI